MKNKADGSISKELSSDQFAKLVLKSHEAMKATGPDGKFNVLKFAKDEKIRFNDAKKIFLIASGMVGFHVKYSEDVSDLGVMVSDLFKLSLRKNDFEYLNSKRDPKDHFKVGDVFLLSSSGENIVLTRKPKSS